MDVGCLKIPKNPFLRSEKINTSVKNPAQSVKIKNRGGPDIRKDPLFYALLSHREMLPFLKIEILEV